MDDNEVRGLVIVSDAGLVCADPEAGGGDHFPRFQAFIGLVVVGRV
ncbi:hypothetical protein GS887_27690 [Rhodococcus hoagii]|nr:hypothetical protein [Prescottella equi]